MGRRIGEYRGRARAVLPLAPDSDDSRKEGSASRLFKGYGYALQRDMRSTRFLSLGGMVGLTLLALAGCGNAAAAKGSSPTATATCPPAPKVTTGTLATVSGSQMTVKDRNGQQVVVNLTSSMTFTEQKTAA